MDLPIITRRRYGSFKGGIELPDDKDQTLAVPIHRCRSPGRLRVPLSPCGGAAAKPLASRGQQVAAGERIAAAEDDSAVDVFAPLAGTVGGLTAVTVAGRYGLASSPAIELTELSEPRPIAPAEEVFDWRSAGPETLRSLLAAGGLATYRESIEPLAALIARARGSRCGVLIANVMEDQPYVTADHRLLAEQGRDVVRGLALLARAIGAARVFLVADQRRTEAYRGCVQLAQQLGIEQVALSHKYPTGADAILVNILTKREMPPGGSTMQVGAAVVGAATCFAAYRQVACGQPPTGRVVTVSGDRLSGAGNFFVPFGMGCVELAGQAEPPLLHGGPMTGSRCGDDVVVGPATNAVLAIGAGAPPAGPCIRCAWCTDHCPARLNVSAMNDAFELSQVDRAERLGAMACVECGVCSYVCPARLPLTQRMKRLKHAIRALLPIGGT